ncbi:MAG: HAMP domain-containing sensor histidine kinase [Planctomycetota bacterium]|nr:HAMP domain-containing sensor histidine kinase [Planctomycetota bacterium]MDA1164266.1 HAMP domain-containing sensor histidine kinase [Planctomycetota bacterium]
MRAKPLILLLLIVCLPVVGLAWLAVRVARDDKAALQQRFEEVFMVQLRDIDGNISRHFESLATQLRLTVGLVELNADRIRILIREHPHVRQIIVLDRTGVVLHPDPSQPLNSSERDFLSEAQELIRDRDLIRAAGLVAENASGNRQLGNTISESSRSPLAGKSGHTEDTVEGWHTWYWGRGVHLIFWQRRTDGTVVGIVLERGRWMADLIAGLPETVDSKYQNVPVAAMSRFRLVDSMGNSMYEWGRFEPPHESAPLVEQAVSSPLNSWRLQALVPNSLLAGVSRGTAFQLASGIGAVAGALAVLVVVFWREYSREIQQAAQRVSFVNQVSHELKTPLTNIRMYADLLAEDLEGLDEAGNGRPADRLRVIVSESQRLTRLISNVLTFGRQQREAVVLRLQPASIDEIVRRVVEQFAPTFERLGVRMELELAAESLVLVDDDAVEQILVNLVSNVEKYAATGGVLRIATSVGGSRTKISVSDAGPGIPSTMCDAVFEPFVRVSSRLEDAAGTGIGLSIARDLARVHGGDLSLLESTVGASFCVDLSTPEVGSAT